MRFLEPVWPEMPALGEREPKLDVTEEKDTDALKAPEAKGTMIPVKAA